MYDKTVEAGSPLIKETLSALFNIEIRQDSSFT